MLIQPVDYFLLAWFVLALGSALYVGWDQYSNNPEPVVMKWGFILVTLYMGPLGLLLYVLADKEPRPGEHEKFIGPLWKQGVGSTIHCVAGDASGIILAAVITASLGLPMWLDLIVEYLSGFSFGLFIFQSLFMQSTMGGSYLENVRKSFRPEFISMNFMMAGMAPVMSFLMMGRDMRAMEPTELLFWGVMALGVIAGFVVAYPANIWMVKRALKHGLMTDRKAQHPAELVMAKSTADRQSKSPNHATRHAKEANPRHVPRGDRTHGQEYSQQHSRKATGNAGRGSQSMQSDATSVQIAAVAGVSLLALITGMVAPANWRNLALSARDVGGASCLPV